MKRSLRSLLAGVIDYAGFFPPANLTLDASIGTYGELRRGPDVWMLGHSVVPIGELERVAALADDSMSFSVVGRGSDSAEDDFDALQTWQERVHIAAFETRLTSNPERLHRFTSLAMKLFLEVPACSVIADPIPFALKLRTGGLEASSIPSVDQVAAFVDDCARRGIQWKATAGLHHPFRSFRDEVGAPMHGFLNLLVAVVLAEDPKTELGTIVEILADENPGHFHFDDDGLRWQNCRATIEQIEKARRDRFVSFGSCSFDEPRDELRELGLW